MSADGHGERILVVKLADLGDVLLSEPALRSLRHAFPTAEIDLLVPPSSRELAALLGHVSDIVTFPKAAFDDPAGLARPANLRLAANFARRLRGRQYTRVVLLHHLTTAAGALKFRALARAAGAPVTAGLDNGRGTFLTHRALDRGFGACHEAEYMLAVARAAGGVPVDPGPRLRAPDVPVPAALPDGVVALFPAVGGYSRARAWPAERFAAVASSLACRGVPVAVLGAADASAAAATIRAAVPDAIDLTGRTSLAELAAVVARAALVVGGDSFGGHLAAALDRPVVSIFGPTNSEAWRPWGASEMREGAHAARLVVRHPLPCEPCLYTGYRLGRREGCPARTCLDLVRIDDVLAAVDAAMEASSTWEAARRPAS